MKRSRFTETQIISILSEVDACLSVREVSRKHGIRDATYCHWKSKCGGMSANERKRPAEVEEENAKLKRMYADMALENAALKDLIEKEALKPPERRGCVGYLVAEHGLSKVKACRAVGLSRSSYYQPGVGSEDRDRPVIDALNKLLGSSPTMGLLALLRSATAGWSSVNHKRVHRIYKAMGLNLPRRKKHGCLIAPQQPLDAPRVINKTWSIDFMSDALYSGKRLRTLNVIDDGVREVLSIVIDTSLPGGRVVRTL